MSRPRKPEYTPEELAAIVGLSNHAAAAVVSAMRGADRVSISHAEALRRSVSKEHIRRYRHKTGLAQNGAADKANPPPAQNATGTDHTGPRMVCANPSDRAAIENPNERPREAEIVASGVGVDAAHQTDGA